MHFSRINGWPKKKKEENFPTRQRERDSSYHWRVFLTRSSAPLSIAGSDLASVALSLSLLPFSFLELQTRTSVIFCYFGGLNLRCVYTIIDAFLTRRKQPNTFSKRLIGRVLIINKLGKRGEIMKIIFCVTTLSSYLFLGQTR